MNYRAWQTQRPEKAQAVALAEAIGAPVLLARVLLARGLDTPQKALELLAGSPPMSDAFLLRDMDKAAERILRAVDAEESIVIYGDYDVDGITATALLCEYLRGMGANVRCMLPSREGEGYGLTQKAVETLAAKGCGLIITVDNGISAAPAAQRAKELGIDLVITDHHLVPDTLPEAAAVVDPARPDDESPFKELSGAGVAFKLCAALAGCAPDEMLEYCGDLAAIGTVADVMPLVGENRTLVKAGLGVLRNTERPGLAALLEAAGIQPEQLSADNISYGIAPRLNAAGRMGSAGLALRLLLSEDEETARRIAGELGALNTERQAAERAIMEQVEAELAARPALLHQRILVLWGEEYHPGVVGIVASRLAERYGRPVMLITLSGEEGKGSGRSVPGINLHTAIAACSHLLLRYGGHALAAGLSLKRENLEAFRAAINSWAAQNHPVLTPPPLRLDAPVRLEELEVEAVKSLEWLAPCGSGNPEPLFLIENALLDGVWPISEGRHIRLRLRQDDATFTAVWFGMSEQKLPYAAGERVDVAISLSVYEGGRLGPQVSGRVRQMRPAGLPDEVAAETALYTAFRLGIPLTEAQRETLRPSRDEVARVYRLVRKGGVRSDDLNPLFARLNVRAGRVLVSLRALAQLRLIEQQADGSGLPFWRAVPAPSRRELTDAPILQALEM